MGTSRESGHHGNQDASQGGHDGFQKHGTPPEHPQANDSGPKGNTGHDRESGAAAGTTPGKLAESAVPPVPGATHGTTGAQPGKTGGKQGQHTSGHRPGNIHKGGK